MVMVAAGRDGVLVLAHDEPEDGPQHGRPGQDEQRARRRVGRALGRVRQPVEVGEVRVGHVQPARVAFIVAMNRARPGPYAPASR